MLNCVRVINIAQKRQIWIFILLWKMAFIDWYKKKLSIGALPKILGMGTFSFFKYIDDKLLKYVFNNLFNFNILSLFIVFIIFLLNKLLPAFSVLSNNNSISICVWINCKNETKFDVLLLKSFKKFILISIFSILLSLLFFSSFNKMFKLFSIPKFFLFILIDLFLFISGRELLGLYLLLPILFWLTTRDDCLLVDILLLILLLFIIREPIELMELLVILFENLEIFGLVNLVNSMVIFWYCL